MTDSFGVGFGSGRAAKRAGKAVGKRETAENDERRGTLWGAAAFEIGGR
jgi:hypothetical protein